MNPIGHADRPAEILHVEDNNDDVFLTRLGFEEAELNVNVHHVENGEVCMRFLRKEGEFVKAPTPDLILLDLNMPNMDGREVLVAVSQDESISQIPIVVLTTAADEQGACTKLNLHQSSFLVKPVNFSEFKNLIRNLGDNWSKG